MPSGRRWEVTTLRREKQGGIRGQRLGGAAMNLPFGRVRRVYRCDLHNMYTNPPGHIVLMNRWEDVVDGEGAFDRLKAIAFRVEPGGAGRLLANPDIYRHISDGVVVIALCSDEGDANEIDDWFLGQPSRALS
jgi:hypothetical protein